MSPQKIISFGYKHGLITSSSAEEVVIDSRKMFRNPYAILALRNKTGLHPEVQKYISDSVYFSEMFARLKEQATVPGVRIVYIGCTGGRHRSVFLAEKLGKELQIPVEHRDLQRDL